MRSQNYKLLNSGCRDWEFNPGDCNHYC